MEAAARERRFRNVEEDAARIDRARFELGAKNAALQEKIVGMQGRDSIQYIVIGSGFSLNHFFTSNAAKNIPESLLVEYISKPYLQRGTELCAKDI